MSGLDVNQIIIAFLDQQARPQRLEMRQELLWLNAPAGS
jgi:hypothetical protein